MLQANTTTGIYLTYCLLFNMRSTSNVQVEISLTHTSVCTSIAHFDGVHLCYKIFRLISTTASDTKIDNFYYYALLPAYARFKLHKNTRYTIQPSNKNLGARVQPLQWADNAKQNLSPKIYLTCIITRAQ